jgi:hypothetical protein
MFRCAHYRLALTATVAVLAGCSTGGGPQVVPSGSLARQNVVQSEVHVQPFAFTVPVAARSAGSATADPDQGTSWMEASAKSGQLLYISDYTASNVTVYRYPAGALVGTLTGFDAPQGECVDSSGNVWITNSGTSQLFEYAHGGTSPIATLVR